MWYMPRNNDHENYELITKDNFKNLDICPKCHCLIYNYVTKNNVCMPVTVFEDMTFHRYGNHNNYVSIHDCDIDKRESVNHKRKFINCAKVSDDIKNKTSDLLQQQALTFTLNYKNVRSTFKKNMKQQAFNFMNGNSTYRNPFSIVQAIYIVLGDTTQKTDYNEYQEKKNIENIESKKTEIINKIVKLENDIVEFESITNEPKISENIRNIFANKIIDIKKQIDNLRANSL